MKKIQPKQDQGLTCKENKAKRAKPKKHGPICKKTRTAEGTACKI
jgi:hypothetical protein